jgi:hypothetical protein
MTSNGPIETAKIIDDIRNFIEIKTGNNYTTIDTHQSLSNSEPIEYCTDVVIRFPILEKVRG